ncbi:MAG: thiamine phosphate synthase [Clostridia bacterium]|nr:thiamine phosphate synthase [Clostridia bacterium]
MCTCSNLEILVITSRKRFGREEDFLKQIERIAEAKPFGIVLREKDLPVKEYSELARKVRDICRSAGASLIVHGHPEVARELGIPALHMPLNALEEMSSDERKEFEVLGASCHSVEDVLLAKALGCDYVTAGHVYATDCKPGLPPRGADFLAEVCGPAAPMPVFALGGLTPARAPEVRRAGTAGFAMMSSAMDAENPAELFRKYSESDSFSKQGMI